MKRVSFIVSLVAIACGPDLSPDEARLEAEKIWAERCTNCHGPRGLGDGQGALILRVKPRALADSGWQASVTDEHIATVIVDGGQSVGLSPDMAANPDLKTKPEVLEALVAYVRSLAP